MGYLTWLIALVIIVLIGYWFGRPRRPSAKRKVKNNNKTEVKLYPLKKANRANLRRVK